MDELISKILEYLEIENNISLISVADDGLPEVLNYLRNTENTGTSKFLFCSVSYQFIESPSPKAIETEINQQLELSSYRANSITDAYKLGHTVVVLMDDLDLLEDFDQAANATDALLKKYHNKLLFIYLLENPLMLEKLQQAVWSYSSTQEVFLYHQVGKNWNKSELAKICEQQYKQKLSNSDIEEISAQSNNHYGLFKRLYRDKVINQSQIDLYVESLLSDFSPEEVNAFKKAVLGKKLSNYEAKVVGAYHKVNFINIAGEITIPILAQKLQGYRIKGKVGLDDEHGKLTGLDLDLLTRTERNLIEKLMEGEETLAKSDIADLIWGDESDEKYSDWAIDQRMSRLKRKLRQLGFNIDIKTQYGKGYSLEILDK